MVFYECTYKDEKNINHIGYTNMVEVTQKTEYLTSVRLKEIDGTIDDQIIEMEAKSKDGGAVQLDDGWITTNFMKRLEEYGTRLY